jgi:hypothetical protein
VPGGPLKKGLALLAPAPLVLVLVVVVVLERRAPKPGLRSSRLEDEDRSLARRAR